MRLRGALRRRLAEGTVERKGVAEPPQKPPEKPRKPRKDRKEQKEKAQGPSPISRLRKRPADIISVAAVALGVLHAALASGFFQQPLDLLPLQSFLLFAILVQLMGKKRQA